MVRTAERRDSTQDLRMLWEASGRVSSNRALIVRVLVEFCRRIGGTSASVEFSFGINIFICSNLAEFCAGGLAAGCLL